MKYVAGQMRSLTTAANHLGNLSQIATSHRNNSKNTREKLFFPF